MSAKSERKKAIKVQKQAEVQTKIVPIKFEGFELSHDQDCKCDLQTIDTIEDLLIELGFVTMVCPFEGEVEHQVYAPEKFDTECPHCAIKVVLDYATLADRLWEEGLTENSRQVFGNLQEFVRDPKNGKRFFHPNFSEVPGAEGREEAAAS